MHCAMIQTGEIQAIVGDADRNGAGGRQYCGLWSLTSQHRIFNAFGNSYAGLIPGYIRGKAPTLRQVDELTCALSREADEAAPWDATAVYQLRAPYYIDHELIVTHHEARFHPELPFAEVSWCSYMNCPLDTRINYLSGGEWRQYQSPEHGRMSRVAPSYVPREELEPMPTTPMGFHFDWNDVPFDEPFYYGRLGDMALIYVFDNPRDLRFYLSPSGGSMSLRGEGSDLDYAERSPDGWPAHPELACPAWDFLWIIPKAEFETSRQYRFRMRAIYKRYESDEDVLAEVRKAQTDLAFEKAPPGR